MKTHPTAQSKLLSFVVYSFSVPIVGVAKIQDVKYLKHYCPERLLCRRASNVPLGCPLPAGYPLLFRDIM